MIQANHGGRAGLWIAIESPDDFEVELLTPGNVWKSSGKLVVNYLVANSMTWHPVNNTDEWMTPGDQLGGMVSSK